MQKIQLSLTKTYRAFHAPDVKPGITTAALRGKDKKTIEKQYGKEVWNLWNHLERTPGACSMEEAIAGIVKLRELHAQMNPAITEADNLALPVVSPHISGIETRPPSGRSGYQSDSGGVRPKKVGKSNSPMPFEFGTLFRDPKIDWTHKVRNFKVIIRNSAGQIFKYHVLPEAQKGLYTEDMKQILPGSLLAEQIIGKNEGDSFEFGGREFRIVMIEF
jgi:hypothetical protein